MISQRRLFLHLLLLSGLAVAQPLFDLVGANPEFLAAHRLDALGVVLYAFALSVAIPALWFLCLILIRRVSRGAYTVSWALLIIVLASATAMPALTRYAGLDGYTAIAASASIGVATCWLYFRYHGFREFFSLFALAVLVFPLKFLFFSPVAQLLDNNATGIAFDRLRLERTPPVFFLLFDEFPLVSILNSQLEIDSGRFPNLARLAEDATWYRRHTTNSDSTLTSVPALLSGNLPYGRNHGLPSLKNYPDNIFVLLGAHYAINAMEHGSRLCPESYCGDQPAYTKLLVHDSLVILAHLLTPPRFAAGLPAMNDGWINFGTTAAGNEQEIQDVAFFKKTLAWNRRMADIDLFNAKVSEQHHGFHYLHAMLPHSSWQYLPDGRLLTVSTSGQVRGIRPVQPGDRFKHVWYDSEDLVRVARQRHLLQAGFVDTLIGDFIAKLKNMGIYDESLVIISSDHGMSFQAGAPRRNIVGDNLAEIAGVPLLIKYPDNRPAGTSDINSQAMDIVPTILDVLGARGWQDFDGESLLDPARDPAREKRIYTEGAKFHAVSQDEYATALASTARRLTEIYGQGDFESLFRAGDANGLIGKQVSDFPIREGPNSIQWEYPQLMGSNRPDRAALQLVAHARIGVGPDSGPARQIAITVNGAIRAVTGTFSLPGYPNNFEALLPPGAFTFQTDRVEAWFVSRANDQFIFESARNANLHQYGLVFKDNAWYLRIDDEELPVTQGEVPGWCSTLAGKTPDTIQLGGWAADLAERQPAESIIVFVNGEFHLAIAPDRDTQSAADRFNMPEILRSAFLVPIAISPDQGPKSMEVRLFALSPADRVSELNYPRNRDQWAFKQNPVADGPAIKPYR